MYCPHCDYFTDDENERECPRCAIRLSPAHLTDNITYHPPAPTGWRRLRAICRDPGEFRQAVKSLYTFTPRDLLRLGIVLLGAALLALGTYLPIISIGGAGRYSLQQLADLIAVLRKVAAIEGAGLMLIPVLGKVALAAIILGTGGALLRWKGGISLAASLSLVVALIATGGYYNLMRQVGPELERRLAETLQQQAANIIHPYPATVVALIAAAALFQIADMQLLNRLFRPRKKTPQEQQVRYSA